MSLCSVECDSPFLPRVRWEWRARKFSMARLIFLLPWWIASFENRIIKILQTFLFWSIEITVIVSLSRVLRGRGYSPSWESIRGWRMRRIFAMYFLTIGLMLLTVAAYLNRFGERSRITELFRPILPWGGLQDESEGMAYKIYSSAPILLSI